MATRHLGVAPTETNHLRRAVEGAVASCSVGRNTNIGINHLTDTIVQFTVTEWNTNCTVGTDSITVPRAGLYLIEAVVPWAGNSNGRRNTLVLKNGTATANTIMMYTQTANAWDNVTNACGIYVLAANDVIRMRVAHDAGATLNMGVGQGNVRCRLKVDFLHT